MNHICKRWQHMTLKKNLDFHLNKKVRRLRNYLNFSEAGVEACTYPIQKSKPRSFLSNSILAAHPHLLMDLLGPTVTVKSRIWTYSHKFCSHSVISDKFMSHCCSYVKTKMPSYSLKSIGKACAIFSKFQRAEHYVASV